GGEKVLPPPSNLNYSFIQICTLNWTWNPPENISSSCDLEYSSDILIDEVSQHKNEMRFKVRSECKNSNKTLVKSNFQTCPAGVPGTAAVGLSCVWHNLEYMLCMWHPGENASSDTNYSLFYWFVLTFYYQTSVHVCNQGNIIFNYFHLFLFCMSVKPATPTIAKLSYVNNGIHLQWSESGFIPANCLSYEVRYHNGDLTTAQTIQVSFHCLHLTIVFCFVFPVLKILILPPIPDPREILKRMFGEQNEDPQVGTKLIGELIKEEEIHSLILIETPESSNSEKEHR
uniref:Interleukin 13 receptor subunit alpha 1 n=1 Tax=Meleagris gallopavo TaxID=9103 RepID=A0A803YS97_MELGA